MTKAVVEKIAQFEGQEVLLQGWLAAKRSSGKIHFFRFETELEPSNCDG